MDQMEVIDCGPEEKSTANDCSICIVNDFKFRAVDPPRKQSRVNFATWWPVAARSVIAGIYGDIDNRRNAAKALIPLLESFPKETTYTMRISSPDALILQDLYSSRLMFDEQHMRTIKDRWVQRIQSVIERGGRVIRESINTRDGLRASARKMIARYEQRCDKAKEIVEDELRTAERRLAKETDSDMRILRAEALADMQYNAPDTYQLDQRISDVARRLTENSGDEVVSSIRELYNIHTGNISHDIARQISEHCEKEWMHALR